MDKLHPKRRGTRVGDRVYFRVMPWFFRDGTIYNGTIVNIRTFNYGKDKVYYVDTHIGEQHVEEGMVLGREVVAIAIMKTKPRARKAKISRRRLKVYQRRASVRTPYDPIVTSILQSLGLVRIDYGMVGRQ